MGDVISAPITIVDEVISSPVTTTSEQVYAPTQEAMNAYELAKAVDPTIGTLEEWLASLAASPVEMRVGTSPQPGSEESIQWKLENEPSWIDLIPLESLRGPQGAPGQQGDPATVTIDNDVTLAGNSTEAVPSVRAAKTYTDNGLALKANLDGGNSLSGTQVIEDTVQVQGAVVLDAGSQVTMGTGVAQTWRDALGVEPGVGGYDVEIENPQPGDVLAFQSSAWVNVHQENLTDGGNW